MAEKDTPKTNTKTNTKTPTRRKGRPSTLAQNRVNLGLRIDGALLNTLRGLADNAQMFSLNAYITAVLIRHTKAHTTK